MTSLPERAARRCYSVLNPLHSCTYFAPETADELGQLGVKEPRGVYFAARSAPLGRVGAAVVTATFYGFKHELVAQHVPGVWEVTTPEAAIEARYTAVDAALHRMLGAEASAELAEAAELAVRATEACSRAARPLYAAHAEIPIPQSPVLALWHATTLLREHRGDGHLALLVDAELDGLESVVSHSASDHGMNPEWARKMRGWSEEEWAAAEDRLRERGLLAADGTLTEAGSELRKDLEHQTDRLDRAPYEHLGAAGVERLTELASTFAATLVAAGAFPADLFPKR
ncbi:SCO6745 family protein [Streptomyces sp. 796.1]|uniref:SCO6745 family protein n=1 Tax=Streptomyces sp. 796.1 TaxID=3163029 RepID=UPI0039C99E26